MADATVTVRLSREDAERIEALTREVAALREVLAGEPIPLPQPTAFERDFGAWMEANGAVRVDEPAGAGHDVGQKFSDWRSTRRFVVSDEPR